MPVGQAEWEEERQMDDGLAAHWFSPRGETPLGLTGKMPVPRSYHTDKTCCLHQNRCQAGASLSL